MKKTLLIGTMVLTLMSNSNAVVAISGTAVNPLNDSSGSAVSAGMLGLLVVDVNDGVDPAGFSAFTAGTISDGASLTVGSTFGSSDIIVARLSTSSVFGTSSLGVDNSFSLDSSITEGDQYSVVWFPTLADTETTVSAGIEYGITTESTWLLPGDGAQVDPEPNATTGTFNTVVAVPETSTALFSLVGLSLLGMRRRRS